MNNELLVINQERMIAAHKIETIRFSQDFILLNIKGNELTILPDKLPPKLKPANDIEKNMYKISPSGYGIHWPLILSIDGILRDFAKRNYLLTHGIRQ